MAEPAGRRLPLSLPRRWVADMLHFAAKVPVAAAERTLRVRPLAVARRKASPPPSWNALIVKALGIVSLRVPELRRAYLPYPWPHLYESPYSVASVVFDREFRGEAATFFCPMVAPERRSLADIRGKVAAWKADPVERHGALRRIVRNAKPPWPVRRLLWATGLYASGQFRARNFGTFAVNSIAGIRGRMLMFQTPITSVWYYGAPNAAGEMLVQVGVDHRVLDGVHVNRAWGELERVLNGEMVREIIES